MLGQCGLPSDPDVPLAVHVGGPVPLGPVPVCGQRISSGPPLPVVSIAHQSSHGDLGAVGALRFLDLRPAVHAKHAVPVALVVHQAHPLGLELSGAPINLARLHVPIVLVNFQETGNPTKSKQYLQVGNSVPPLLAEVIVRELLR
jgi:hypothetical protein